MEERNESVRNRVLILTPVGRDGDLARSVLQQERFAAEICSGVEELCTKLEEGAGAAVIADEALNAVNLPSLAKWVKTQPAWSDFPFIILTAGRTLHVDMRRRFEATVPLGNVTLLERPLRSMTLLTVVKSALRARTRQYEVEHYVDEVRRAETERSRAFAGEEAAHVQIELLNHLGEILAAELNLDALLPAVVDAGTDLSGADLGVFFGEDIVNPIGRFHLRCASGITMGQAAALLGDHTDIPAAEFAAKRALRWAERSEGRYSSDDGSVKVIAEKLSLRNCIALPVSSRRNIVVGVLLFGHSSETPFSEREERVVASLASQASIAIDNARLFVMAEQERSRLEVARQALQRSNDELRQFAYVASHDLQEPLRTVASFTQLLVSRYREIGAAEADEFVSLIVDGVERMSVLIHDLLEYSHTGVQKTLPSEPAAAESALEEVLFSLSAAIQESGATITHDPLPEVWLESRSLVQLLQNLIGNAIKYRGRDPLHVHVSAELTGEEWHFSVTDNGIGIAPQYHSRIFGIFKRLHGKEIPGTGIGLAICQRIVEWHGGRIWVDSELGSGAVFHFTLAKEPHQVQREMAEFASLGDKLSESAAKS
jgi:signal transduction histidine kinase/DNA-binding response OmpR family regulator